MDANGNSEAQIGYGSGFFLGLTEATLIELDEVTKLPFAEEMADDVEKTHFKSPGRRKEYGTGLIEPGEDTLELNYIPGSPTDLLIREAQNSGKPYLYEAYVPAPQDKWNKVSGYLIVKSRGRNIPIGDRMTQSISVRFTGASDEEIVTDQRDTVDAGA
jgi:hypothetical protein